MSPRYHHKTGHRLCELCDNDTRLGFSYCGTHLAELYDEEVANAKDALIESIPELKSRIEALEETVRKLVTNS